MHALLLSEEVALDMILPTVEHDVCTLGIDVEITVFAADGAVATRNLVRFQRWHVDFVLDGATVAVGFVPDPVRSFRLGHGAGLK